MPDQYLKHNLRSDCRDLVKDLPPGDVYRAHIERLCHQIDELELRWLEAEGRLGTAREMLKEIVCVRGDDRGVIFLSHDAPTRYDPEQECMVYLHENFSPLGDALVNLWSAVQSPPRSTL